MTTLTARRCARLGLCSVLVVGGVAAGLVVASGIGPGAAAAPEIPAAAPADDPILAPDSPEAVAFALQHEIELRARLAARLESIQQQRADTVRSIIDNLRG